MTPAAPATGAAQDRPPGTAGLDAPAFAVEVARQVRAYLARFPDERDLVAPLLEAIGRGEVTSDRVAMGGHVTASGILLRDDRLLLIRHPYLQRWLQPGGHVEPGETPLAAAVREVREETGIAARPHPWHARHPCPFDINIHRIPANPAKGEGEHRHFDLRYWLVADAEPPHGEHPGAWVDAHTLTNATLRGLVAKLRMLAAEAV